jgi:hypothetical protein
MGHIKIIEGPLEAGGLCDIYRGDLMSEQGAEPLAIKLLRVFNRDRHVAKAKKVHERSLSLCITSIPKIIVEIQTGNQPLVLTKAPSRASFLWNI